MYLTYLNLKKKLVLDFLTMFHWDTAFPMYPLLFKIYECIVLSKFKDFVPLQSQIQTWALGGGKPI